VPYDEQDRGGTGKKASTSGRKLALDGSFGERFRAISTTADGPEHGLAGGRPELDPTARNNLRKQNLR